MQLACDTDSIRDLENILSPGFPSDGCNQTDKVFHLVQDEPLIARIHNEELPPDSYYEELAPYLQRKFPKADPDLVEHVVALAAAFDTASAFALSLGIKKFQFAQKAVKLVGEIVGEHGRQPNPALCEAIRKWSPVKTLKDLHAFLGLPTMSGRMRGRRMLSLCILCVLC